MIDFFFIIDFSERVQLEIPILKHQHFSWVVRRAKERLLSKAKSSDCLIEKLSGHGKKHHLYAKTNDDNFTVFIVTEENENIKDQIWALMKDVLGELKDFDLEKEDLEAKRAAIQAVVCPHLRKDPLTKIGTLTSQTKIKVQDLQTKASQQASTLLLSLEEADQTEKDAQEFAEQTNELRSHYWWEEKKMEVVLIAIGLFVVLLSVVFVIKFVLRT